VVIPRRWALYQEQHFAKELEDGSHEIPVWAYDNLVGEKCGPGMVDSNETAKTCTPGLNTWNYTFIYPMATYGADPTAPEGSINATTEGEYVNC
jgi:hypothetical protein